MAISKYLNFFYKIVRANFSQLTHPYKIFLVVTKSCGSKCTNCHIWKETPTNELSLDEYKLLAKNMNMHLSWLNISGGEPTDRHDLIEIIKIFIEACPNLLIINFTSNGLNPEKLQEVAEFLAGTSVPIVGINVSIDGNQEVHQRLRGGSDSYQKAISSLKLIRKYSRLHIHASMTLFKSNAHLIDTTFEEIKKHIPDFKRHELHLNYSFHSEHYYQNKKADNSASGPQLAPVFDKLFLSTRFFHPMDLLKKIYLQKLIKYEKDKKNPLPCSSMRSNVYISEHGELYPCTIWNSQIGSLRNNRFNLLELLNSPRGMEIKEKISHNDCPNCWSPCEAFPSILDNIL